MARRPRDPLAAAAQRVVLVRVAGQVQEVLRQGLGELTPCRMGQAGSLALSRSGGVPGRRPCTP